VVLGGVLQNGDHRSVPAIASVLPSLAATAVGVVDSVNDAAASRALDQEAADRGDGGNAAQQVQGSWGVFKIRAKTALGFKFS